MEYTGRKVFNNLSWIIVCKIIQSILGVIIGALTARYLGTANYGLINYAATLVGFVMPIAQVGQSSIIIQETVENENNDGEMLGSSMALSFVFSAICYIAIIVFVLVVNPNETDTLLCCLLYGITLFFQAIQLVVYWFQAKLLSKVISIISLMSYVVSSIYKIILLHNEASIMYFALANSIDIGLIAILGLIIFRKMSGNGLKISKKHMIRMFHRGKYFILPGILITAMGYTDRIMLKIMIDNSASGIYSAALNCGSLTSFIFGAIIDSMRPIILSNKNKDEKEFKKSMSALYFVIIYASIIVSIFTGLFSRIIVTMLYGEEYLAASSVLVVVVWHALLSYIGSCRDIWLLANEKQSLLLPINLFGAIANIFLNIIFIRQCGAIGAAIASVISQFLTYIVLGFIIKEIRENTILMLKGFKFRNLKYVLNFVKDGG